MEFLREYAVAAHVYIPIVKRAVVDFAVSADWTPATGDVKISKDGGTAANINTLPTAITMGNTAYWDFVFTTGELTCAQAVITVGDSATKAVEDQFFAIATYGNASARHKVNFNDTVRLGLTGIPNAAAGAAGGLPLGDASGRTDVGKVLGTAQTARDLGAQLDAAISTRSTYAGADTAGTTTLLTRVTGTLPLASDYSSARATKLDNLDATVSGVAATVWAAGSRTLTSFGSLVANIWDALLTSITTSASIGKLLKDNITGDTYARLGAPVGASHSVDVAAVKTVVDGIKTKTDQLIFTVGGRVDVQVAGMNTSTVDANALATDAVTEIMAAIKAIAIDGTYTLQQVLQVIVAAVSGKLSGAGTGTIVIRDISDTKNIITTTVDATGRLTVTFNV